MAAEMAETTWSTASARHCTGAALGGQDAQEGEPGSSSKIELGCRVLLGRWCAGREKTMTVFRSRN